MYNFVAKKSIVDSFKGSKHFKINMGHSLSVNDGGDRKFRISDKDKFTKFYHDKYNIALLSEGNIGTLNFFSDYYIDEEIVVVFFGDVDFIFVHEADRLKKEGVDSYLGSIIQEIEKKYEHELVNAGNGSDVGNINGVTEDESGSGGDADKLVNNPGAVTWEDIEAHYRKKRGM